MADDIEIGVKLKADFKEWKETANSVPGLTEAQRNSAKKGMDTAEKALNAKDWEVFSKQFNKVSSILTQALAATGNISEALQKSLDLKKKIEKSLNDAVDRVSQIKSKYADDSMSAFTKQGASKNFNDWTKTNGAIKSAAGQTLGRDESATRLEEALRLTNGSLNKLTDELAKQAGFGNRQEAFKANRYFKSEEQTRQNDIKEVTSLNKSAAQDQIDLKQVDDEIARLKPVSEEAAAGLEELYKKIVQLTGVVNTDVTQQKAEDREAKKAAEGGGAATTPNLNANLGQQSSALKGAFKQFTIYALAVRTARKALKEAVKTVKELDKSLTEQAMVTGLTRKQTYALLPAYQQMAAQLGATTKEVANTMTQFLRQGRSIAESTKLSEAAIAAAKVASIDTKDSINYLTTAINGFRLSANDAMKVSDKFAAVAATAATSYEEIAIALSKVAAQANLAGMSIDYTTALLTKGIETTREAPETIGTALKTVIARMRELSDYGATLEGDVDLNNVESQLAYIGIQLRDNNGELRSTEDVLNDLGGKWDTLNANQQAAIAKALAGTRQQARLIAMMSDYERVIELQEVAQRSQGATMAQMATYMEGMEAATNRVSIAWETIVKTLTNSESIIGFVNGVANLLDAMNQLLSIQFLLWTGIALAGIGILVTMFSKHETQKAINRSALEEKKAKTKELRLEKEVYLEKLKQSVKDAEALRKSKEKIRDDIRINKLQAERRGDTAAVAKYTKELQEAENDVAAAILIEKEENLKLKQTQAEITGYKIEEAQLGMQINANAAGILGTVGKLAMVLSPVLSLLSMINIIQQSINAAKMKEVLLTKEGNKETAKGLIPRALNMFASVIDGMSKAGPWGVIAGIAMAIALVAGLGVGIAAMNGAFKKTSAADKTADEVNSLSKEIYNLNKKLNAIDNATKKFDELDNKIIKTKEDLQEMSSILESVADSLSDEEKETYNALTSDRAKREYLDLLKTETEDKLDDAREKQAKKLIKLHGNTKQWNKAKNSTEGKFVQMFDAMYALNNAKLYKYTDALNLTNTQRLAVEALAQSILDNVSKDKAEELLENPDKIKIYTDAILKASDAVKTLNDSEASLADQVRAYEEIRSQILNTGDQDAYNAFIIGNKQWEDLSKFNKQSLEYVDSTGKAATGMNVLAEAMQDLGSSAEKSREQVDELFNLLAKGYQLGDAMRFLFPNLTDEEYNKLINTYEAAFGTTVQNMGQNVDKFLNSIDALYEKSAQWKTMSEADKTSFLSENPELFEGKEGADLWEAFQSGDYTRINDAISKSSLAKTRENLLRDVEQELRIQYAKNESERDAAYIAILEEYRAKLQDVDNIYLASLERRLEQQKNQLDMYKDLLQKEADALTESLEKRKDAYQKYFDAINKEYEDEEYEEQAQTLIANISKLSSSTNADAIAKTADLTKQLEELEKERLQTLRQQAQEQVIKNIEDEVSKISDNLEDLLKNEQALLNAMMNDVKNPSEFIASMLTAQAASGNNTALGMQSYLQDMQSTFASIMPGVDWSNVEIERQGDSLILNILGKEVQLSDTDEQTIYDAIRQALVQIGKN